MGLGKTLAVISLEAYNDDNDGAIDLHSSTAWGGKFMKLLISVVCVLFLLAPTTDAAELGSTTASIAIGGTSQDYLQLEFGNSGGGATYKIFNIQVTPALQGMTFVANATTDPLSFPMAAMVLTDGVATNATLLLCDGLGFFCTPGFPSPAGDYDGNSVDSIEMTLDQVIVDTGENSQISVNATIRFFGEPTVPVAQSTWGKVKSLYH